MWRHWRSFHCQLEKKKSVVYLVPGIGRKKSTGLRNIVLPQEKQLMTDWSTAFYSISSKVYKVGRGNHTIIQPWINFTIVKGPVAKFIACHRLIPHQSIRPMLPLLGLLSFINICMPQRLLVFNNTYMTCQPADLNAWPSLLWLPPPPCL